jgi:FtsP/CotA-like multicopper oxidase with cupredoxin domain
VWLYHSHVQELEDVNAGLIGAIVVTRAGMAGRDGKPTDVDREFVALFQVFDENESGYLDKNVAEYLPDAKGLKRLEILPTDVQGNFSLVGSGFVVANQKGTINGYLDGTGPVMRVKRGERVRWYVVTVGLGINFHTPHWHGNVVLDRGHRTDVISLAPAQMETVDMVPDDPGLWLFHCHLSDHMEMGTVSQYEVQ